MNFFSIYKSAKKLGFKVLWTLLVGFLFGLRISGAAAQPVAPPSPHFDIAEYEVDGGHLLTEEQIEEIVYPYLGPERTPDDVEKARAALEKAYQDKGFPTVFVRVTQAVPQNGVVVLNVIEAKVENLRVTGARYFSPNEIKRESPSMAEGTLPNFNAVNANMIALNELSDRRVTPSLHMGVDPDTVDIDLAVKDSLPLHGSLEINNRYSQNTTPLRVNGSVNYDNLWQLEHSLGFSFQLSPENLTEVQVFSGYYSAPVPGVDWLSLMIQGTDQDSNVSTLGGSAVAGKGQVLGPRFVINLPAQKDFYQSFNFGFDYKHFDQNLVLAGQTTTAPVTYYPVSANYTGSWIGKGYSTVVDGTVVFSLRGAGSPPLAIDNRRSGADSSFIYFRGDISHTRDLPGGFQIFVRAQGQAADEPLLDSEEFSGGGLDTARGYLESEALGDNALFGTGELRTPSLGQWIGSSVDEWRFYAFTDDGLLTLNDPLPEQTRSFTLASVGAGTRLKLLKHLNGSLDLGVPLVSGPESATGKYQLTFRVYADF